MELDNYIADVELKLKNLISAFKWDDVDWKTPVCADIWKKKKRYL